MLLCVCIISCSDIYDNIKNFSPEEIVYPAQFDTIGWKYGYERVEFDLNKAGRVPASQMKLGKAEKTVIEYDDRRIVLDSVCSWVNITGLTEKRLYNFKIYTEDQYGDKSIAKEVQLTPFTAADLEMLSLVPPNVIESTSAALVEWGAPVESDLYQFFSYTAEYTDRDGQKHSFEGGNLPSFFVENVLKGVDIPIKIKAKIIPITDGKPLLDTVPAWESYFNLRISEASKPAIFLKTPAQSEIIHSYGNDAFPIDFTWTKVDEVSGYLLKLSRSPGFEDEMTKTIRVGNANEYSISKESFENEILPVIGFDPLSSPLTYYWQVEPEETAVSIRLQSRAFNWKHVEGELVTEYIEATDPRVHYEGGPAIITGDGFYRSGDCAVMWRNNSLTLTFTGRALQWYALYNNDLENADIYIDNQFIETINCWSIQRYVDKLFEHIFPVDGEHTIRIVGTGNAIVHDYFVVIREVK
jgi:hypothetical protein